MSQILEKLHKMLYPSEAILVSPTLCSSAAIFEQDEPARWKLCKEISRRGLNQKIKLYCADILLGILIYCLGFRSPFPSTPERKMPKLVFTIFWSFPPKLTAEML